MRQENIDKHVQTDTYIYPQSTSSNDLRQTVKLRDIYLSITGLNDEQQGQRNKEEKLGKKGEDRRQ